MIAPRGITGQQASLGSALLMVGLVAAELGVGFAVNDPPLLLLYFAAVVGLVLVVATLLWPQTGVVTMPFLLFTQLTEVYGPRDGLVTTFQMMIALFLVAALSQRLLVRREGLVLDRALVWMLLFGAAMAISSLGAADPLLARADLAAFLREVLTVFVLLNLIENVRGLRLAAWTLVVAGAFLAFAALASLAGFNLGGLAVIENQYIASGEFGARISGPIGDSNEFARVLLTVLPLALYCAWDERRRVVRLAALGALGLLTVALVMTFSRGGILGLIAAAAITILRRRIKPAQLVAFGLGLGLIVLVAPQAYWDRMNAMVQFVSGEQTSLTERDSSLHKRSVHLQIGALMFLEHPLIGVGKGNYKLMYPRYAARIDPAMVDRPQAAHSLPLHVAAETGVVGLIALVGLLIVALRNLHQARRRFAAAGLTREALLTSAIEIALYSYLVASLFLNYTYARYLLLLIGLAIIARQVALRTVPLPDSPATPARPDARPPRPTLPSAKPRRRRPGTPPGLAPIPRS